MIELKVCSVKGTRDDGYGWNLYLLSTAGVLCHEPAAETTLDSSSSTNCAIPDFRRSLNPFIARDRSEQRRWTVVAGDDVAVRGNPRARVANWKSHVLDPWRSLAVVGPGEQHGYCNCHFGSKHLLFESCFFA